MSDNEVPKLESGPASSASAEVRSGLTSRNHGFGSVEAAGIRHRSSFVSPVGAGASPAALSVTSPTRFVGGFSAMFPSPEARALELKAFALRTTGTAPESPEAKVVVLEDALRRVGDLEQLNPFQFRGSYTWTASAIEHIREIAAYTKLAHDEAGLDSSGIIIPPSYDHVHNSAKYGAEQIKGSGIRFDNSLREASPSPVGMDWEVFFHKLFDALGLSLALIAEFWDILMDKELRDLIKDFLDEFKEDNGSREQWKRLKKKGRKILDRLKELFRKRGSRLAKKLAKLFGKIALGWASLIFAVLSLAWDLWYNARESPT